MIIKVKIITLFEIIKEIFTKKFEDTNILVGLKNVAQKIKNRTEVIIIINFVSCFRLILKISFDANVTMYTNKTINPPKKIKNKINENHELAIQVHSARQMIKAIIKIDDIIEIGWEAIKNMVAVNIKLEKNK